MSLVQPVPRTALRPDRGIISVIEGGGVEPAAGEGRPDLRSAPDAADAADLAPLHHQATLGLLDCAARALEFLYQRRDELETAIGQVSMQAESAVMAAQAKMLDWQKLSAGLTNEALELERRLAATLQRAELAEKQLEAERARADRAERQAAEALDLSQGLHAKILSSFGRGSFAHRALLGAIDDAAEA